CGPTYLIILERERCDLNRFRTTVEAANPFGCCAARSTVIKLMATSHLHRFRFMTTEHGRSLPRGPPRKQHYLAESFRMLLLIWKSCGRVTVSIEDFGVNLRSPNHR
ncbi:unnamed protein product, partial [Musa textilis]